MRLLIIDDDPLYSWIIKKFVERVNPAAEVVTCTDAREALGKIINEEIKADLIILDWDMPLMNGFTFANTYAQLPVNHIPIIVHTNSIYKRDRERAKTLPLIKGYFVKPVNTNMIKEMLSYALLEKN